MGTKVVVRVVVGTVGHVGLRDWEVAGTRAVDMGKGLV